jgi:Protein of unknown function (DUF2735)
MNTNLNGGSAKIYQFPEGGRAAMNGHRTNANAAPAYAPQVVSEATYGSWYHDEAIRESQQADTVQAKSVQPKFSLVPLTFPRQ